MRKQRRGGGRRRGRKKFRKKTQLTRSPLFFSRLARGKKLFLFAFFFLLSQRKTTSSRMATPFEKASGSPAPEGNGSAAPAAPAVAPAAVQPTSNVAPLTSGGAGAPARAATPGGAGGGLPRVGSDEPMRRPMTKRTNSLSDLSR